MPFLGSERLQRVGESGDKPELVQLGAVALAGTDGPSGQRVQIAAVGPRPRLATISPFHGWPSPDHFPGDVQSLPAQVWTGAEYEDPTQMVFGEQRLRMRVGVTRAVRSVTITYAQFTDLGVIDLPRIEPSGADG